jgi:hypothetical protein
MINIINYLRKNGTFHLHHFDVILLHEEELVLHMFYKSGIIYYVFYFAFYVYRDYYKREKNVKKNSIGLIC